MPESMQIRYMLQFWSSYIRLGSAWWDFINLVAYTYPGSFFQTLPSCITLYVQIFHTCMVIMFADKWRDSVHKLECNYNQKPYHLAKTKLECMWSSAETRTWNHYKIAVRNFHALNASRWFPHRHSKNCQCLVVVRWAGQLALGLPYTFNNSKPLIATISLAYLQLQWPLCWLKQPVWFCTARVCNTSI